MGLFDGNNWVYTIHIFIVAPLLLYISTGYLFNRLPNKGSDSLYEFAMWVLLVFSVLVFVYHGYKLIENY